MHGVSAIIECLHLLFPQLYCTRSYALAIEYPQAVSQWTRHNVTLFAYCQACYFRRQPFFSQAYTEFCSCRCNWIVFMQICRNHLSGYSDSQRAGRSGDRIPVGARFSARVQTGSWAHPASCKKLPGLFPGCNAAEAWRWPPTPT